MIHFFKEAKEDLPSFPWEDVSQLRSVSSDMAEWVYKQNFPILLEISQSGGNPSMRERYRFGFVTYAYGLFQKEPPLECKTPAFSRMFGSSALFGYIPVAVQYLVGKHAPLPSAKQLSEEREMASHLRELLFSFYTVSVTLNENAPNIVLSDFELPIPQSNEREKEEWHEKLLNLKETGVYLADILEWYEEESVKTQILEAAKQFIDTTEKYLSSAHWARQQSYLKQQRWFLYNFLVSGNRDFLKKARSLLTSDLDASEQAFFYRVLDAALAESDPERCRFYIRYMTPYPFKVL